MMCSCAKIGPSRLVRLPVTVGTESVERAQAASAADDERNERRESSDTPRL